MVRHRLPSSTYYTPAGEMEWSREQFGNESIAVLSGAQRNPIEMARHVASRVKTQQPFFVMDIAAVLRRLEALRAVCPRLRATYSVACNADPVLARLLANNEDMSFEVSNSAELKMASLYIEPSRTMLCSQLLTRKTIRNAAESQCGTFVIETEKQLNDVMNSAPDADILLAINLGYSTAEVAFGCAIEEIEKLIELAHLLGANLTGLYIDLGHRARTDEYISALQDAKSIFDAASERFVDMRRVAFNNLGFSANCENIHSQEFAIYCSTLNQTIDELFGANVDVSANVGRFLVTNAFTLCTNVIGKRELDAKFITNDDFDDGVGFVYQTNDGVYGSFGCRQMDINPLCKPLNPTDFDEPQHFGTILGPSLDRTDVAQQLLRCRQLSIGEWLVWEQMGAFTIPVDSEHPTPPVYYYSGKDCWQKLIDKDEQRRSPSPTTSCEIDEMGSDGEGGYDTADESDPELMVCELFDLLRPTY